MTKNRDKDYKKLQNTMRKDIKLKGITLISGQTKI